MCVCVCVCVRVCVRVCVNLYKLTRYIHQRKKISACLLFWQLFRSKRCHFTETCFFKQSNWMTYELENQRAHYTKPESDTPKKITHANKTMRPWPWHFNEVRNPKRAGKAGLNPWHSKLDPNRPWLKQKGWRPPDDGVITDLVTRFSQLHRLRSAVRAETNTLKASSLPGATLLSGWSRTASRRYALLMSSLKTHTKSRNPIQPSFFQTFLCWLMFMGNVDHFPPGMTATTVTCLQISKYEEPENRLETRGW